jgi:hypothetical protein
MPSRGIRNVVLTIASATVLAALSVVGASTAGASTNPECYDSVPWACVQIFGNGLYVADVNGWAHNQTATEIDDLHIELYIASSNTYPSDGALLMNSSGFNLPGGDNSSNLSVGPLSLSTDSWLCSAVWQYTGSGYVDLGHKCAEAVT